MNDIEEIKKQLEFAKTNIDFPSLVNKSFLYINYPFCSNLCAYCIYKVHKYNTEQETLFFQDYNKEIDIYNDLCKNKFNNLHIGGGTPNLADPEKLLGPLKKLVDFNNINRFVFEMFPMKNMKEYLEELKKFNVTKIQLGVQTLNEGILKTENRPLTKERILESLKALSESGIIWSVDLIYGFKEEFNRDTIKELQEILKFNPEGIHTYAIVGSEENNYYGNKNNSGRTKTENQDLKAAHEYLAKTGYTLIKDEWCKGKNINHAEKTFCYDKRTGNYSHYFGIGPKACTFTRFFEYENVKDIKSYNNILTHNTLPISEGSLFLENHQYLLSLFYKLIEASGRFHLNKILNSQDYSKKEKNKLKETIEILIQNNIQMKNEQGILIIAPSDYTKALKIISDNLE